MDIVQVVSLPNEECSVDSLEMEDINQVSVDDEEDINQVSATVRRRTFDTWEWGILIEEDDYDDNGRGGDIDDEFSVGVAHKYIGKYLYR